ncbi:MAG: hypothetical protein ACI4DN_11695 [Lachnospiraceae bacterium]
MSLIISYLLGFSVFFEIISAGVLTYAIAASKADDKMIIKTVLLGTVAYAIVSITMPIIGAVMPYVVFPIVFCILGSQTGNKFNVVGLVSLIAYLVSLFTLPIISNKYEDSLSYQILDGLIEELGGELAPTQFGILNLSSNLSDDSMKYLLIMFCGAILFAILFFDMALLRKNTAQVVMGSIISVFTVGMLYFDYSIFHSKSLVGKLVGYGLSELGFSLSVFSIVILLLAILPVVTAYLCNKKG